MRFESKDYSVQEALFGVYQLRIPQFQRPYTWEEDQCNDFWNDLIDDDTFFLGQFILNHETYATEKVVDIVDGQQRTTSILILSAVLRDRASDLGFTDIADVIQYNSMLAGRTFSGPQYRITVSPTIKDFFEQRVQNQDARIDESLSGSNDEETRVIKNYLYFKQQLEAHISEMPPSVQIEEIKRLFEMIKHAQIIVTKIYDENDAYEIFESVNATGVELNAADLLKNYLFKKIKAEDGATTDVAEKWLEIVNLISDADLDLTKFLRYYWLSKYEFVSEAKLFKAIKNKNLTSWKFFLQELLESAKLFSELRNPLETDFSGIEKGERVKTALIGLKEMNITQCYVLLLSIYRNRERIPLNWTNVFEWIEKFNFIYHTTSKLPANRVEKMYNEYASRLEKLIEEEEDRDALRISIDTEFNSLKNKLISLLPNEEVFTIGFVNLTYKKRGLCRYILTKIEESLNTSKEYTLNQPALTLEHILPQRPGRDWNLTPAQIKNYVHNIGNLTLLGKKPNGTVQNKSIKEKIKILKDSTDIKITKNLISEIEESEHWDENSINKRARELAGIAFTKVWKLN